MRERNAKTTARRTWFRSRWIRWGLAAVAVGFFFVWVRHTRDLEPHFAERRGVLAGAELERRAVEEAHVVEYRTLRSTSGLEVRFALHRPADSVPRPAIVLLGGHETGRDAVDLLPGDSGLVVAALDYPLEGPRRPKGLAVVAAVPRIQRAILDTPPAIRLVADWLFAQDFVDPERLELVGVSLGAPFACVAGGLDERFRRVWSVHGGGRLHELVAQGLESRIGVDPLRDGVARLATFLAYGVPLAPERWVGAIAPRELVMLNAKDDERMPARCVQALFDAAREPKELLWTPGGHVDPDETEIVEGIFDAVLERIRAEGPIPPAPG